MTFPNFVLQLSTALLLISCGVKPFDISGNVISALSEKPVNKCVIVIVDKKNHHSYHFNKTDSSGNFKLLNLDEKTLGKDFFLLVAKYGYVEKFVKIERNEHITVKLEPVKISYSEKIPPGINSVCKNEISLLTISSDKPVPELKF